MFNIVEEKQLLNSYNLKKLSYNKNPSQTVQSLVLQRITVKDFFLVRHAAPFTRR